MELEEAHAIVAKLGLTWEKFINEYADTRWPGTRSVLLRHYLHGCLFLNQPEGSAIGLCSIHEFKPQCCRDWQAKLYKKECRQGLAKYWNLSVDETNHIAGSPEALKVFQAFLDSLT